MADETEATGAWSRPDGALEPEDYVEEQPGANEPDQDRAEGAEQDAGQAGASGDPLSPGASVVEDGNEDGGADAVEPNEPG